jgi:hypothetical protein
LMDEFWIFFILFSKSPPPFSFLERTTPPRGFSFTYIPVYRYNIIYVWFFF